MSKKKLMVAVVILLVVVVGGVAIGKFAGKKDLGIPVETARISPDTFSVTVSASGTVEPVDAQEVRSPVQGQIGKLAVDVGDHVKRGQLLLTLDETSRGAQLEQARSALEQANIALRESKNNLARMERLYAAQAISQKQLEDARAQAKIDESRYRAAEKQYQAESGASGAGAGSLSGQALADGARLLAPADGTIVGKLIADGAAITPGLPLFKLANVERLLVRVKVDEADVSQVKAGQEASITSDAVLDLKLSGRVTKVAPEAIMEGNVSKFPADVEVNNASQALKSGMSADVEIVTYRKPKTLFVPIQAVVERRVGKETKKVVFVFAKGLARQTPVTTGLANMSDIEITEGLKPGDEVIIGDYQTLKKLKDGDKVRLPDAKSRQEQMKKSGAM
ncbi:MAG: efflux RND transporter periplasmic adaptor subunit [Firmicutes bacterium]|nr:efflux RND transporter periplasmic adaptor subunit [Bacillota bacterium]